MAGIGSQKELHHACNGYPRGIMGSEADICYVCNEEWMVAMGS
jgi:hypothetical protein